MTFDHVGEGLKSRDESPLKRFEIAGEDKVRYLADAKIEGEDVSLVNCAEVAKLVAVRYAWASNPEGRIL